MIENFRYLRRMMLNDIKEKFCLGIKFKMIINQKINHNKNGQQSLAISSWRWLWYRQGIPLPRIKSVNLLLRAVRQLRHLPITIKTLQLLPRVHWDINPAERTVPTKAEVLSTHAKEQEPSAGRICRDN